MNSGNNDEYDDLVGIHKGIDDLSYSKIRRFGGNYFQCFGCILIIGDQYCI